MYTGRRRFLKLSLAGAASAALPSIARSSDLSSIPVGKGPIVLSTWSHGSPANLKALQVLAEGGSVLDAVEQGVMVVESDLSNRSVGLGGLPDREGKVTLDACIQDHDGRAGAVAFVQDYEHPICIARAVMERTPHVMLVGSGAERWASENGFKRRKVDIPEVRKAWKEWLLSSQYKPGVNSEVPVPVPKRSKPRGNIDQHDTIAMIAMDAKGQLAGSCTTSGLAWKVHGRVGDSPIVGAGLFVDGEIGAACATGVGELILRTVASHSIVEHMRQGMDPGEACRQAVLHILRKNPDLDASQVGFLALRRDGVFGAWGIYDGFNYVLSTDTGTRSIDAGFERSW